MKRCRLLSLFFSLMLVFSVFTGVGSSTQVRAGTSYFLTEGVTLIKEGDKVVFQHNLSEEDFSYLKDCGFLASFKLTPEVITNEYKIGIQYGENFYPVESDKPAKVEDTTSVTSDWVHLYINPMGANSLSDYNATLSGFNVVVYSKDNALVDTFKFSDIVAYTKTDADAYYKHDFNVTVGDAIIQNGHTVGHKLVCDFDTSANIEGYSTRISTVECLQSSSSVIFTEVTTGDVEKDKGSLAYNLIGGNGDYDLYITFTDMTSKTVSFKFEDIYEGEQMGLGDTKVSRNKALKLSMKKTKMGNSYKITLKSNLPSILSVGSSFSTKYVTTKTFKLTSNGTYYYKAVSKDGQVIEKSVKIKGLTTPTIIDSGTIGKWQANNLATLYQSGKYFSFILIGAVVLVVAGVGLFFFGKRKGGSPNEK